MGQGKAEGKKLAILNTWLNYKIICGFDFFKILFIYFQKTESERERAQKGEGGEAKGEGEEQREREKLTPC